MDNILDTKAIRTTLGISIEQLAVNLGVSVSAISKWESGDRHPGRLARKQIERLQRKAQRKAKE